MKLILKMNKYILGQLLNFVLLFIFALVLSTFFSTTKVSEVLPDLSQVRPLQQAYAHNDYVHARPLTEALSLGFCYVEADVHLIKGRLYVSHYKPLIKENHRSLSKLYLEPLFNIQKANGGTIYPNRKQPLVLMIDIKTEAISTYHKLKEALIPYASMLSRWNGGLEIPGAVTIIISGNRAIETIAAEKIRYVQIDGRLKDLPQEYPAELMPIISANYTAIFGLPYLRSFFNKKSSVIKLTDIVTQVHRQGKVMRLWNSPEQEACWEQLLTSGMDVVNTDQLQRLNTFLKKWNLQNEMLVRK